MTNIINALTVDVEDWFQVGAFETTVDRDQWTTLAPRVERNTNFLLELFARKGVKATFFTLGCVAEQHPALIRKIVADGHELASHGYNHQRVFTFTADEFRADLRMSRKLIEDAGGVAISGYRAPSFSIDKRTPWAHVVLAEEGYSYSSSVAPIVHDHYGWPQAPRFPFRPRVDGDLVEWPVTTARLMGRTVPAGGGGFFRILPYAFSRWAIRQVNGKDRRPTIMYFHPWEIDADQPRLSATPLKSRLRHYTNLGIMASKLERLIDDFSWGTVASLLPEQARDAPCWPTQ